MTRDNKPFAKIYAKIYQSSVAENWKAMVTFQQFIILSDWDGVVDMTVSAICRITNLPRDLIEEGISLLERPDPQSRTPAREGRRLVRLDEHRDWGWRVVNLHEYLSNSAEREAAKKEYMRQYMRKYRDKGGDDGGSDKGREVPRETTPGAPPKAAPAKPAAKPAAEGPSFKFAKACALPENFCVSPRVRQWCDKNKHKPKPEAYLERFTGHFAAKGTAWKDWDQTFINYIRDELPGGRFYSQKHHDTLNDTPAAAAHKPFRPGNGSEPETIQDIKSSLRHAEQMHAQLGKLNNPQATEVWQKEIDRLTKKLEEWHDHQP